MSARCRVTLAAAALAAACCFPAAECRAGQAKPLTITPSRLTAGEGLYFDVRLNAPISAPFDVYCFADTIYGVFTLMFDGWVIYGLQASYTDIWGYEFPYARRVYPWAVIPTDMRYNFITFYLFITPAGQVPPFTFVEELGPNTANIVLFDSVTLPVQ